MNSRLHKYIASFFIFAFNASFALSETTAPSNSNPLFIVSELGAKSKYEMAIYKDSEGMVDVVSICHARYNVDNIRLASSISSARELMLGIPHDKPLDKDIIEYIKPMKNLKTLTLTDAGRKGITVDWNALKSIKGLNEIVLMGYSYPHDLIDSMKDIKELGNIKKLTWRDLAKEINKEEVEHLCQIQWAQSLTIELGDCMGNRNLSLSEKQQMNKNIQQILKSVNNKNKQIHIVIPSSQPKEDTTGKAEDKTEN